VTFSILAAISTAEKILPFPQITNQKPRPLVLNKKIPGSTRLCWVSLTDVTKVAKRIRRDDGAPWRSSVEARRL